MIVLRGFRLTHVCTQDGNCMLRTWMNKIMKVFRHPILSHSYPMHTPTSDTHLFATIHADPGPASPFVKLNWIRSRYSLYEPYPDLHIVPAKDNIIYSKEISRPRKSVVTETKTFGQIHGELRHNSKTWRVFNRPQNHHNKILLTVRFPDRLFLKRHLSTTLSKATQYSLTCHCIWTLDLCLSSFCSSQSHTM